MEYKGLTFHPGRWLGNILVSAGFPYHKVLNGEYGRCRGAISKITPVDHKELNGKVYNFFTIFTVTAWQRMSLMWLNIIRRHYEENSDIHLAFTSYDESFGNFEIYNPENILKLAGYNGDEKYMISKYLGLRSSLNHPISEKDKLILSYIPTEDDKIMSAQEAVKIVNSIVGKNITINDLEEDLKNHIDTCNAILSDIIPTAGLNIIPIIHINNLDKEI